MTLLAFVPLAFAAPADLASCCDASGVAAGSCPSQIAMVGAESQVRGVLVSGVWVLACGERPVFEPAGRRIAASPPGMDQILTPLSAPAMACFAAACDLPPDLCLDSPGDGRSYARACGSPDAALAPRAPVPPSAPIAPVAPAAPAASRAMVVSAPALRGFVVPSAPEGACVTNQALRKPSNEQVDLGDDARLLGDTESAAEHYRAAILVNPCNPFAWAGLGTALREGRAPELAVAAYAVSTQLMPGHHLAWTGLGELAEARGDTPGAGTAYTKALAANPSYEPARAALARVSAL